jgi:hypothetical protein
MAVLAAGKVLDDGVWQARALDLALRAAQRDRSDTGVKDAGLCHGAAGLMHIFHRLHQTTDDARLLPAIRRWFHVTAELHEPGRGSGGFARYVHSPTPRWIADVGLLSGCAGVGLALHSLLVPDAWEWDRALLSSVSEWSGACGPGTSPA